MEHVCLKAQNMFGEELLFSIRDHLYSCGGSPVFGFGYHNNIIEHCLYA